MKGVRFLSVLCLLLCPVLMMYPGSACAKCIGKDRVNIRSAPSLKSRVLYRAPLGYPIAIEKVRGKWVFFRDWENDTGWVHKSFVSDIETAVVRVAKANVRSSAGTRFKVVARAKEGEIYKVLARKGSWVRLGYYSGGEAVGWVRADLVFGE